MHGNPAEKSHHSGVMQSSHTTAIVSCFMLSKVVRLEEGGSRLDAPRKYQRNPFHVSALLLEKMSDELPLGEPISV